MYTALFSEVFKSICHFCDENNKLISLISEDCFLQFARQQAEMLPGDGADDEENINWFEDETLGGDNEPEKYLTRVGTVCITNI